MTEQEKQAVEIAAQIAAGGKVPYTGKPGTGIDGFDIPGFLDASKRPTEPAQPAKPEPKKLPVPKPKGADGPSIVTGKAALRVIAADAASTAPVTKVPAGATALTKAGEPKKPKAPKAAEKPAGATAKPAKGKTPGKGKKLAGAHRKGKTKPAAAKKAAAKKPASGDLKPGTKNALLVDLITKAGATGIAHEAVCKKLGWVRCRVTARRLFDRIGKKLRIEGGVFYAGE